MKYMCVAGDDMAFIGDTPMDAFAALIDECGKNYKFNECKFYQVGPEVITIIQPKPVAKSAKKGK